jgi:hypothetical protein
MTARIFKPAKTAMQSGTAKTREWQLDYEPEQPRVIEPLMGWTSSGDMKQQLSLRFETKEEGWPIASARASRIRCSSRKSGPTGRSPMPTLSHSGAPSPGPTRIGHPLGRWLSPMAYPGLFPSRSGGVESYGLPKAAAQ